MRLIFFGSCFTNHDGISVRNVIMRCAIHHILAKQSNQISAIDLDVWTIEVKAGFCFGKAAYLLYADLVDVFSCYIFTCSSISGQKG